MTENELRDAFCRTNTEEPLAGGWPGLLLFAREVEALTETKKCECSSDEACAFVRQRDALSERLGACLRVFEAQQTTGEFTIPPRQEFMDTLRDAISNAELRGRPLADGPA